MTQPNQQQTPLQVAQLHRNADTDSQPSAAHHTLGSTATQALPARISTRVRISLGDSTTRLGPLQVVVVVTQPCSRFSLCLRHRALL